MTDTEMLSKLAAMQDAVCDVMQDSMTIREIRGRLNKAYGGLDAAVMELVHREAAAVAL